MANHKSALKRNRQSLLRRDRNRAIRTKVKNMTKAVDAAIDESKSAGEVQLVLQQAIPVIQRAAVKGTLHQRTASRKISRLTKRVNKCVQSMESAA